MNKLKAYLISFRLRTLPLSLSGIILGIMIAADETAINFFSVFLLINTTISLQILSNIANEYGDIVKGTDNENRLGPIRSIQSGVLSKKDIITTIILFIILCIINGTALLFYSLESLFSTEGITFLILGALAILAAIFYTMGKHAYGYKGLGEVFVFIFFGLVSTIGSYVISGGLNITNAILPASAIGFLSCAVLNINNMRDIDNDKANNKITVAVRIGLQKAKIYHIALILLAVIAQTIYYIYIRNMFGFPWFSVCTPILIIHIVYILKNKGKNLDKQMPIVSLTTILFAILSGI